MLWLAYGWHRSVVPLDDSLHVPLESVAVFVVSQELADE